MLITPSPIFDKLADQYVLKVFNMDWHNATHLDTFLAGFVQDLHDDFMIFPEPRVSVLNTNRNECMTFKHESGFAMQLYGNSINSQNQRNHLCILLRYQSQGMIYASNQLRDWCVQTVQRALGSIMHSCYPSMICVPLRSVNPKDLSIAMRDIFRQIP